MDAVRVASILIAIVIIAGIAYVLQERGGGGVMEETTTTGTTTSTATPVTRTMTTTHESTTRQASTETIETGMTTTQTTQTMTQESQETPTKTEASETTSAKTAKESGEGITPLLPGSGDTQPMRHSESARIVKVARTFKGDKGWIEVKSLSIMYDEDKGLLNVTVKLATPDPCWKVKVDLETKNKTAQVTIIATRNPQDICIMMVKENTVTAAGPAKDMPTTIILRIVIDGSVEEIPINIGEEYTGK